VDGSTRSDEAHQKSVRSRLLYIYIRRIEKLQWYNDQGIVISLIFGYKIFNQPIGLGEIVVKVEIVKFRRLYSIQKYHSKTALHCKVMPFKWILANALEHCNVQIESWKYVVGFSSLKLISEIVYVECAIETSFLPWKEVFWKENIAGVLLNGAFSKFEIGISHSSFYNQVTPKTKYKKQIMKLLSPFYNVS